MGAGLVSIALEDANADPDHPGGCGARALRLQRHQKVNPSSQTASQVFAGHYVDYNPYDPISYAQNNTGRGGGGR